MNRLITPLIIGLLAFGLFGTHSAHAQWTFGFEDADYIAEGGGALSFTETFDGVANSADTMDAAYFGATSNDFIYAQDYRVVTGLDANEGNNFAIIGTDDQCIGFSGSGIGLVDGQDYTVCFWAAALDESGNTSFSVSPALETANGGSDIDIIGTDEQGLAVFTANYTTPPDSFIDPGWDVASTTTNDSSAIEWVQYCTTFTFDSAKDDVYISGFGDDSVGTSIAFDNVSFTAVPEPSSAMLCVFGGLALLLRRRRRAVSDC